MRLIIVALIACFLVVAGGIFGYMVCKIDASTQRIILAEQAAELALLRHIVASEIPAISERIDIVGRRFEKCNAIAARMGISITYPYVSNDMG